MLHFEEGQRLRERVHGAAVFQVTNHGDGEPVERRLLDAHELLLDQHRVHIEQRLRRVLARAVAAVENRNRRNRRCALLVFAFAVGGVRSGEEGVLLRLQKGK